MRGAKRIARLVAAVALATALLACGQAPSGAPPATLPPLESIVLELQHAPLERQLDGKIEAVNQGTVAAQTSGRVTEILYDVNDFVPAGAVIVRIRATEQRAGLLQAEAALREATARETEARQRYERVVVMFEKQLVAKAAIDEASANRDAAVAHLAAARAAV